MPVVDAAFVVVLVVVVVVVVAAVVLLWWLASGFQLVGWPTVSSIDMVALRACLE